MRKVAEPWQSEEARERFIRFLELELTLMECGSLDKIDPSVLEEFDSLLTGSFPKTLAFVEQRLSADINEGLSGAARMVAWAEARSIPVENGVARVPGSWTEREIAEDVYECVRDARDRMAGPESDSR